MAEGILAYGAYLPRRRLQRRAIIEANAWFDPTLRGLGRGERTMAGWDEDPITMAVEAARDALGEQDRSAIQGLRFASTTAPFLDRLNAGVVAAALNLPDNLSATDTMGAQRAGTSALLEALTGSKTTLVVAGEQRRAKAASPLELTCGDGAAAMLVGAGEPLAVLIGSASSTADFVDHFRTEESVYDYRWEDRWVRDLGLLQLVPPTIQRCLAQAGIDAASVTHFCLPTTVVKGADAVARTVGIPATAVRDNLQANCGDTGTAHALLMLADALENAGAGDLILVASFGQGADALLLRVTDRIASFTPQRGVRGHLARRQEETSYTRFAAFRDTLNLEHGMRAEVDKQTSLSYQWRHRATITALVGGRCTRCGTPQFPASRICVAPGCNAIDTQEPYAFADKIGRIASYTADQLSYAPDPPACYGMITFAEGGRWMMDFTEIDAAELAVGREMRMRFRIKDIDRQRGFRRYFWKASPVAEQAAVSTAAPAKGD